MRVKSCAYRSPSRDDEAALFLFNFASVSPNGSSASASPKRIEPKNVIDPSASSIGKNKALAKGNATKGGRKGKGKSMSMIDSSSSKKRSVTPAHPRRASTPTSSSALLVPGHPWNGAASVAAATIGGAYSVPHAASSSASSSPLHSADSSRCSTPQPQPQPSDESYQSSNLLSAASALVSASVSGSGVASASAFASSSANASAIASSYSSDNWGSPNSKSNSPSKIVRKRGKAMNRIRASGKPYHLHPDIAKEFADFRRSFRKQRCKPTSDEMKMAAAQHFIQASILVVGNDSVTIPTQKQIQKAGMDTRWQQVGRNYLRELEVVSVDTKTRLNPRYDSLGAVLAHLKTLANKFCMEKVVEYSNLHHQLLSSCASSISFSSDDSDNASQDDEYIDEKIDYDDDDLATTDSDLILDDDHDFCDEKQVTNQNKMTNIISGNNNNSIDQLSGKLNLAPITQLSPASSGLIWSQPSMRYLTAPSPNTSSMMLQPSEWSGYNSAYASASTSVNSSRATSPMSIGSNSLTNSFSSLSVSTSSASSVSSSPRMVRSAQSSAHSSPSSLSNSDQTLAVDYALPPNSIPSALKQAKSQGVIRPSPFHHASFSNLFSSDNGASRSPSGAVSSSTSPLLARKASIPSLPHQNEGIFTTRPVSHLPMLPHISHHSDFNHQAFNHSQQLYHQQNLSDNNNQRNQQRLTITIDHPNSGY